MADSKVSEELADVKTSRIPIVQAKTEIQPGPGSADQPAKPAQFNASRNTSASTNIPSAAAIQRALSSQRQFPNTLDGVLEGTRDRSAKTGSTTPQWPTSPRLKSPPPNGARNNNTRRDTAEHQSNITKRLATVSAPELAAVMLLPDSVRDQSQGQSSQSQLRVPGRGISAQNIGLETVAEGSVPTTPSINPQPNPMDGAHVEASFLDTKVEGSSNANTDNKNSDIKADSSANKTITNKADNETRSKAPSTSRLPGNNNLAKRSFTSLTASKKAAIEPLRTMTVETEEVNTTTPMIIDRNRDGGSVRAKTSTETIRPRKEKKKTSRKPASLHANVGTSKADIFEAKVASAVDEADTDDSDETFVYESNPPEPRSYRHHSRTPSATSLASTNDHYRSNKHGIRSGNTAIPGKRSMKFSNSMHREFDDDQSRNSSRNVSSTPRHHQIGRHSRNHHPSLFDNDSPFNQARKPDSPRAVTSNLKGLQAPRTNSPRIGNGRLTSPRKYGGDAYDNNEDIADDERAPLMGSVRIGRNRHSRRPHSRDFRSLELGEEDKRSCWSRCSGPMLLVLLLLLICSGLAMFVVAVNRPLYDVEIRCITNVLASEQELMLDLDVKAVNSNLFAISVTDLDVNLFAESPYVGTTVDWHKEHQGGRRLPVSDRRKRSWFWPPPPPPPPPLSPPPPHPADGVDKGTDPDDPDTGVQKMLLGRITEFDSPLTFDAAPVRRSSVSSIGEIRLAKPGNKTEIGGSERWERVLHHDFDLIVRGVIKYQLPLSSKMRSAKIGGRKIIYPDGEDKSTR